MSGREASDRAASEDSEGQQDPVQETDEVSDASLVALALDGDRGAFESLIGRYQQAVFNIAYYKSKNCYDAEDLAQDVFLAAYRALVTLKDPASFSSWLFGIAYNRCHKWFSRERNKIVKIQEVRQRMELEQRTSHIESRSSDLGPAISEYLAKLPEETRTVLQMKYLEGLSYQDIEERMGLKPQRIDYLIRKGKKALRELWQREVGS